MASCCHRSRAVALGSAALALIAASCFTGGRGAPEAEELHVSLVAKDSVGTFLNRLATSNGQVVVTRDAVDGAWQSVTVKAEPGASLHLVEVPQPAAALPGERARIGGLAVVAVPSGSDPHEWLGSRRLYAEPIAEREVVLSRPTPGQGAPAPGERGPAFAAQRIDVPIDAAFLEARLRELSGAAPVTVAGRTVVIRERGSDGGRSLARAWLRQQYEALGFTVQEHAYTNGLRRGVNLTADKAGADPSRVLILSAHYDSWNNAGADDDGSGVVSALAIARALKDASLNAGLRIVAFDQEELGLFGSNAYARMLAQQGRMAEIVGVLQLEMTAYDSNDDGHFHVIHCDENTSPNLAAYIEAAAAQVDLGLTLVDRDRCTNRSDHAAFWRYGAPAVAVSQNFFGGDNNPCYHERCDTVDRLNWDYMRRLTQAVGMAAADILME